MLPRALRPSPPPAQRRTPEAPPRQRRRSPGQRRREPGPGIAVVPLVLVLCLAPSSALAQTATVETEENFRATPNGAVVARVEAGTVLSVEGRRPGWIRATLEGWVWIPSLQMVDDGEYDLRVASEGGENLRTEPQGTILARLEEGALLDELERIEGWIHVRRTAWIWAESVRIDAEEAGAAEESTGAPEPPDDLAEGWRRSGSRGAAILTGPDGDTLARSLPGTELRILGRQGNWARVRLEGWTWLPPGGEGALPDSAVLTDVSPAGVAESPDRYRGRVVAWELQFISREQAESVRADFYEGEPYLLTRPPGSGDRFVYVALPPDRISEVEDLTPLERIVVVGRIRTGSAALTGGPILDLLQISRAGGGG